MKTHIIRRREGETLSDYVTRWVEIEKEVREADREKKRVDALEVAADLDRRYQRDQQDRANARVDYSAEEGT